MSDCERNIKVFHENRDLAKTVYFDDTKRMLQLVKVYANPSKLNMPSTKGEMNIRFVQNNTVSEILDLSKLYNCKVCGLNFADALTPGGLVEYGEVTQEEDICRCSNLYESLVEQHCVAEYYNHNKEHGNHIYSNRLIYSKDVLLFRGSPDYERLPEPVLCDIVTCPAPIATEISDSTIYYNIIRKRIRGILLSMIDNNVRVIVLGAWGCGAFGGDAEIVGRAFASVLADVQYFDVVSFAILKSFDNKGNFKSFVNGFNNFSK